MKQELTFLVIDNPSNENMFEEGTGLLIPPLCRIYIVEDGEMYAQEVISFNELDLLKITDEDMDNLMFDKLECLLNKTSN